MLTHLAQSLGVSVQVYDEIMKQSVENMPEQVLTVVTTLQMIIDLDKARAASAINAEISADDALPAVNAKISANNSLPAKPTVVSSAGLTSANPDPISVNRNIPTPVIIEAIKQIKHELGKSTGERARGLQLALNLVEEALWVRQN
jgi:hypothetical protein